jgi:hypothetical protein
MVHKQVGIFGMFLGLIAIIIGYFSGTDQYVNIGIASLFVSLFIYVFGGKLEGED